MRISIIVVAVIMVASTAHAETCVIEHYISYWYASPTVQTRSVIFRAIQNGNLIDEEPANGEYMESEEKDEMVAAYMSGRKYVVKPTKIREDAFKALAVRLSNNGWVPISNDGSWYGYTFERK